MNMVILITTVKNYNTYNNNNDKNIDSNRHGNQTTTSIKQYDNKNDDNVTSISL